MCQEFGSLLIILYNECLQRGGAMCPDQAFQQSGSMLVTLYPMLPIPITLTTQNCVCDNLQLCVVLILPKVNFNLFLHNIQLVDVFMNHGDWFVILWLVYWDQFGEKGCSTFSTTRAYALRARCIEFHCDNDLECLTKLISIPMIGPFAWKLLTLPETVVWWSVSGKVYLWILISVWVSVSVCVFVFVSR